MLTASSKNPLTIPSISYRSALFEEQYGEYIRMFYSRKFGAKLISRISTLGTSTIIKYLKFVGLYAPGTIPRRGGFPTKISRNERKWMEVAWATEWRGVIEDYTGMYLQHLKNLRASSNHANKKYWSMTPDERKERNRLLMINRRSTPEKINRLRQRVKAWKNRNAERIKAINRVYIKRRKESNPSFKIAMNVRGRIREAIKGNYSAKTETSEFYVGCSWGQLRHHLERQFKRGMSWANYGPVWHIDHIVPCALFDLTKPEELKRCFHFTNLRPLWALENIRRQHRVGIVQAGLGI